MHRSGLCACHTCRLSAFHRYDIKFVTFLFSLWDYADVQRPDGYNNFTNALVLAAQRYLCCRSGYIGCGLCGHGRCEFPQSFLQLGFFPKPLQVNVDEVFVIGKHMSCGDKYFSCDGHIDFLFVLALLGTLHIAEVWEEAVACP